MTLHSVAYSVDERIGLIREGVPTLTIWAPAPPAPIHPSLLKSNLTWLEGNIREDRLIANSRQKVS